MQWIKNKTIFIVLETAYLIFQIANMFMANIVLYEVNEGVKFNWGTLLHNRMFWVVIGIQILHFLLTVLTKKTDDTVDDEITKTITECEIELLKTAKEQIKNGNFKSGEKILNMVDKFKKKRR